MPSNFYVGATNWLEEGLDIVFAEHFTKDSETISCPCKRNNEEVAEIRELKLKPP